MLQFIKMWCEEIIVSVIIALIIEMFLPQGNIKRYVRVIIGIYIIFVVLNPIVNNLDNINIETFFENNVYSNSLPVSNIEEISNVYARAVEMEIKENFNYVKEAKVILSNDLESIEKIDIILLGEVSSLDELIESLTNNYRHKKR